MDILLKRPLKFIPVWHPECRITPPVCLTSLFLSWWVWDFDIFETSFFLSPVELGQLVRCDLLHACLAAPAVVSAWRSNSTAGHSFITTSSAVSLNQQRVSWIDFFFEWGVFLPHYDAVTCGTFYFNIIRHLKWYIMIISPCWIYELSPSCHDTASEVDVMWQSCLYWKVFFFVPPAVFFSSVQLFVLKWKLCFDLLCALEF